MLQEMFPVFQGSGCSVLQNVGCPVLQDVEFLVIQEGGPLYCRGMSFRFDVGLDSATGFDSCVCAELWEDVVKPDV